MAITIEQLDDEYIKQDISILVGKSFILKFLPQRSAYDSNENLRKLIGVPDLLIDELNSKARDLSGFSKEIFDLLTKSIETRETYSKAVGNLASETISDNSPVRRYFFDQLLKIREKVVKNGELIQKLEKDNDLYLAQENNLYFCKSCNSYLGDSFESLPEKCLLCESSTDWNDRENIVKVRFLDNKVMQYLDGLWFEDYIAKLLNKLGWKTWCHGHIMGSSGVPHQVDILAVNSNDGRVLIGECKTSKIKKEHTFDLSAQFNDIKSCYGFLFSYDTVSNFRLSEYMKRTAGLYLLDNLKTMSDEKIIEEIRRKVEV